MGTVIRFNVSMDNVSLVHIFYAGGELGENIPDLGLGREILWIRMEPGFDVLVQAGTTEFHVHVIEREDVIR